MTRSDWRFYNVYLIVGMALFFILAFFGDRPTPEEHWVEIAHYDPAMVEGGMIRGTVRYQNAADCTARARQRYHYEFIDIIGAIPMPANGIDAPFIWGCQKIDYEGRRVQDIKR